jgi:hypothetical protein
MERAPAEDAASGKFDYHTVVTYDNGETYLDFYRPNWTPNWLESQS